MIFLYVLHLCLNLYFTHLLYQYDTIVYQRFNSDIYIFFLLMQSLRSQSVLALLHSTLSSSPGDEASFDRLAEGFRSVVPALTQALTEEIHVLSRLAEPHTILGFLNAAYLSIVTQALASLMERESETALRDNTSLTSKIKKYSARSRATVGKRLCVNTLYILISLPPASSPEWLVV